MYLCQGAQFLCICFFQFVCLKAALLKKMNFRKIFVGIWAKERKTNMGVIYNLQEKH